MAQFRVALAALSQNSDREHPGSQIDGDSMEKRKQAATPELAEWPDPSMLQDLLAYMPYITSCMTIATWILRLRFLRIVVS